MIRRCKLWLLRQQRNRQRRHAEEVCASLRVLLIDGRLYVAHGGTLIHRFADADSVHDVANKIDEIKNLNL